MKKSLLSLVTITAAAMALVIAFAAADGSLYASAKAKKFVLPKSIKIKYAENGSSSLTKIKYDKYGNMTSALISEMIPIKYKIKYRNKKGAISSLTYTDGDFSVKKTYNKKGRLTKVKLGKYVYKYTTDKKGTIKKVTINGKTDYTVKSVKYQKNGFISRIVYSNGNVNKYNSNGLMTSAIDKKAGDKYTYKYTKKSGKIVKVAVKKNGKNYKTVTLKYGKSKGDIWKYSSVICYADGPSNVTELYSQGALSGTNDF